MKTYVVGGSVRDELLGRTPKDRDFVVVGSTPREMKEAGFKRVGGSFPVFLHPDTGDEYALARTEKKKGRGHTGFRVKFDPSVTLEEDLRRRDLTINAMAMAADEAVLIDPYGGREDLENNVLRHVSEAFQEDPLRVLRVARFAARYDSTVAPETMVLMRTMSKSGELNHLTPERVWGELTGAMGEAYPARFFEVLKGCGALYRVLPMVLEADTINVSRVSHLDQRLIVLFGGADLTEVKEKLVPSKRHLRLMTTYQVVRDFVSEGNVTPHTTVKMLNRIGAWKDPDLLTRVVMTVVQVHPHVRHRLWFIIKAFDRAREVTYHSLPDRVRKEELRGPLIGLAIDHERERVIKEM